MSKHEPTLRETVAQYQVQARQRQAAHLEEECKGLLTEIEVAQDSVASAYEQGDQETALYEADNINRLEADLRSKLDELNAVAPPQQPQLSDETQSFVARRADLIGRPNQVYRHLTNEQVAVYIDQFARAKGLQEGSKEYLELMARAVDPDNYSPQPTPDDVIETINKTSKYKLDAKAYNKGVQKLIAAKSRGDYPDR